MSRTRSSGNKAGVGRAALNKESMGVSNTPYGRPGHHSSPANILSRGGSASASASAIGSTIKKKVTLKDPDHEVNQSCPLCDRPDEVDEMIECSFCKNWYHYTCEGLIKEQIKIFVEMDYAYPCNKCKTSGREKRSISDLVAVTDNIQENSRKIQENSDRITKLEGNVVFENHAVFEEHINECIEQQAAGIRSDAVEAYKRRNRMIVEGLKEDNEVTDNELAMKLLDHVSLGDVKIINSFRHRKQMGAQPSTIPRLNIELENDNQRKRFNDKDIIDKIKNLSGEYDGIKIYPDRTFKDRKDHQLLKKKAEAKNLELTRMGIQNKIYYVSNMRLVCKDI